MYTFDDFNAAKAELEALNQQWENYSGNNTNKYRASINAARAKVRAIGAELKAAGLLQRTPQEELEQQLDLAFPNARSKQVVEFKGKRYVRRFTPLGKSLSGKTVTEWGKSWEEVPQ
jgi:hypothetical protein